MTKMTMTKKTMTKKTMTKKTMTKKKRTKRRQKEIQAKAKSPLRVLRIRSLWVKAREEAMARDARKLPLQMRWMWADSLTGVGAHSVAERWWKWNWSARMEPSDIMKDLAQQPENEKHRPIQL